MNKRHGFPEQYESAPDRSKRQKFPAEQTDNISRVISDAKDFENARMWKQAAELRLKALRLSQRKLGDEHPETIQRMHDLADTYAQQSLLNASATLHSRALAISKRKMGVDHRSTLRSMHLLACTYTKQLRLLKAETLELLVLSHSQSEPGKEKPDELWAMHQLALIYHKQGRKEEAEALDTRVLQSTGAHILSQSDCEATSSLPSSIYENIEPDQTNSAELDRIIMLALNQTSCHSIPQVSTHPSDGPERSESMFVNSSERYEAGLDSLLSSLVQPGSQKTITTNTPIQSVFNYLVSHKCTDLTKELGTCDCPTAPYAGGRFGDVWCAKLANQTQVAIKCLRLHSTAETCLKNVKRAARELYYWSKAKHNNVLELTGIAIYRGRLAMVSPWMGNGTLHAYINANPSANRWELCEQVAEGVAYIHGISMIHGDLKAVNVLVSDEGVVKLSDFGNSILSDHSLAFTATTNIGGGTSRWMAPELLHEGEDGIEASDRSKPADVYALGMTILEVVTGKLPYFERRTDSYVSIAVMEGRHPERPTEIATDTRHGDERWGMLLECWQMKPVNRPTAIEIRNRMHSLA